MQVEEILAQLEINTKSFPRLALEAAIEQREAITPILLSTLDKLSDNLEQLLEQEEYILHIHALYLLAQFREPLAYPVIIKFFSVPGEAALDVTGDIVTEDLCRIFASVSGKDIEPIKQLIENQNISEYIRGAALEALLVLVVQGVISREEVIQYYAKLYSAFTQKEGDYLWTELVSSSAQLSAIELKEEIEQAFKQDLIDPFFLDEEDVNDELQLGTEAALNRLRENRRYSFIKSVVSEMENWSCFKPEEDLQEDDSFLLPELLPLLTVPKKSKKKAKKKRKMQEQSRRQNRTKKK
jgi:hypothetical protein